MFLRHGVELSTTLHALGGAGGILACGDGVEEERLLGTSFADGPVGKEVVHVEREEALFVHFDAEAIEAEGGGGFQCGAEGVFFRHDVIAASAKGTQRHFESRCGADIEGALPILVGRVVYDFCMFGDKAEQLGGSGSLAVVESDVDIVEGFALGPIMLAGLNKQTGVLGFWLGEMRRFGNFDLEVLEWKDGAGG